MSTTIDSLELEIASSSQSAESGLDKLTASLGRLKTATKGLGLKAVANQINNINTATNGINATGVSNLSGLAKAIQLLGGTRISTTIATQITAVSTALNGADFTGSEVKLNSLVNALSPLSNLPKSNLASYVNNIKKLSETLNTLDDSTISALSEKIQKLATALKPLGDEMQKVANGFSAFPAKIQRLIKNTDSLTLSNNKASTSYINLYAKVKMAASSLKSIGSKIASGIQKMMSYYETINLFSVSMGEYALEADKYVDKVSKVMGIDPAQWMKYQGTIMTLATGFGIAGDRASTMSQQLTQLAYDISSFREIGVEEAMQKIQSGFAGELEPLRAIGYDLSQAKLEAIALSLGIDKSVSSMTQAEKAQLRYYAIMTQVTKAQGDMARTLESPANQMRILKMEIEQAARAIGSMFIPGLNKMLPYLIAGARVVRHLASSIASLFGFEMPEVEDTGLENVTGESEEATESLEDLRKKLKKVKTYMLGFDELNVFAPEEEEKKKTEEENPFEQFNFELPTYDFLGDAAESLISKIVDDMKEWLGITGEITSWADLFNSRLGDILKLVGLIGASIAAWKFANFFMNALSTLMNLLSTPITAIPIGIILTLGGFALEFAGLRDAILNGLDGFNFAEIVAGAILGTAGMALLGSKIVTWIGQVCSTKVAFALAQMGRNLGVATTGALGAALGAAVGAIIAGIPMYFVGIYDACKEGLNWLNATLIPLGSTFAGAGIGTIIGACGGPIGAGIGALIGAAVGLVTDGVILIVQNWEPISEFFVKWWNDFTKWAKKIPSTVKKWFKDLSKNIDKFFDELWKPIQDYDWKGLGYDVGQWFGEAVQDAITFVTETIPHWFERMFERVTSVLKRFFTKTLPEFFTITIPETIDKICKFFDELPEKIYNAVTEKMKWFRDIGTSIIDGIVEGWNSIWKAITDFVDGFVQGFKDALGIHSPSTVFAEIGGYIIEGLFSGMLGWLGKIGDWCKTNIVDPFNKAMDGALTFAVDVINDSKEWWSNVKTWWNGVVGSVSNFSTNVANNASTWWSNVETWWNGVVGNVTFFNTGVNDDSGTWWSNVESWWSGVVDSVTFFSTGVKNDASTWWSNVESWWSGVVGNVKEFGTNVANNASTWWDNTKKWWKGVVGNVQDFSTNVANNASTWWSNVKSWWNAITGKVLPVDVNVSNNASTWWGNVRSWWNSVVGSVSNFSTNISNHSSTWWNNVKSWWSNVIDSTISGFSVKPKDTSSTWWTTVKSWWAQASSSLSVTINAKKGWSDLNSLQSTLGLATPIPLRVTMPKIEVEWTTTTKNGTSFTYPSKFVTVSAYAQGGFPDMGQMFLAREAGPELVGTIGNRSAVVNNDQIVESVSTGVYQAVVAALGNSSDDGGDTQIVINLDGEKIYENQQKVARNRGYNLGMGVFSFG